MTMVRDAYRSVPIQKVPRIPTSSCQSDQVPKQVALCPVLLSAGPRVCIFWLAPDFRNCPTLKSLLCAPAQGGLPAADGKLYTVTALTAFPEGQDESSSLPVF